MDTRKDIWQALEKGDQPELVRALSSDHDLARARDEQGISVVLHAVYRGRHDMVEALLSYRDDLDIFEAAAVGQTERLKELVSRHPGRSRELSPDGFSPLHLACFFGHLDCVRVLIDSGAEVSIPAKNSMAVTPLNSAAASGRSEIVELLLKSGAPVDAAQSGGITALHSAAHNGNEPLVELLLLHGADPDRKTEDGRNAAHLAREKGHEGLARRLERQP